MNTKVILMAATAGLTLSLNAAEKEIKVKDLPESVRVAIEKAYPQSTIDEAIVHNKKGKISYEAEIETKDDKELEVTLDTTGKILCVEEEIEPEKLPASISAAVAKAFPDAEIEDAEILTSEGKTSYEVEVSTKNGGEMDITLDASGKIIKTEAEEQEDEDPAHNKKSK